MLVHPSKPWLPPSPPQGPHIFRSAPWQRVPSRYASGKNKHLSFQHEQKKYAHKVATNTNGRGLRKTWRNLGSHRMPSIQKTDIAHRKKSALSNFLVLAFTCFLAIWNLEGKNSLPVPSHGHLQSNNIKRRKRVHRSMGKIKKCTNYSSVLLSP